MPDYGEDHIVLNVFNGPMIMAEGDTDYERELNRLDCFFYVKDKTNEPCVYYHKAEVNDLGSATIPFIVDDLKLKEIFPSGSLCDVYVIANIPGNPTFEAKTEATTMQALGERVLDMTAGEYDGIGKPFVMTGFSTVQKGKNSNATAKINLYRVASKVTVTVKVPMSITVENSDGAEVTKYPVLVDSEGNVPLKTSFHYGANKGYLSGASLDDPDNKNFISTGKISYEKLGEEDGHYVFTCDMPFYTYARSWDKGSSTAAYITFEMPWGEDQDRDGVMDNDYKTYYYQILVNGKERNFVPNTHYDMTVTVGVLGSTVESLPAELDVWSYHILDWTTETTNGEHGSGDRDEDVEIQKFNYLEVPQTYIEMDNVSQVAIRYNASHKIGVKWDTKAGKSVEGLPGTTDESAFYINNGSGTPDAVRIQDINISNNFTDNGKGWLTFNYTLSSDVYSPAYVFVTIWLDVDGDGVHDVDDEILTEDVKIVIYPAIFIMGDRSYDRSIFVNGNYGQAAGNNDYLKIANQQVGKAVGDDASKYMHVISISAFNEDNYMFAYNNNKIKDTQYIIGDPRVRSSNKLGVGDDNETVKKDADGWIKATDVTGTVRNLQYYYPTSTEANSYQVIAPKFRISSKLGGYSHSSPLGAAYRCASYQEHGFPAGRWRLPTTAEVLYIIELQRLGKIQQLFYNNSTYLSATDRIATDNSNNYTLTKGYPNNNSTVSVRCVYDDWYWGSEREAIANTSLNQYGGYQFTWGDEEIY
ncbi:MAG: hypothetical protein J6Q36_04135 [Alistipes sp.]|nr:hypothetical protein [Alistipes sp.]